ncbi:MAG: large conductance mechanosensitive channel protein MscL [Euzebyales bacterium]|jgi:large conductance mechanosensitive channel|nr:large conductance mechanosensitive channel protein MscL [Euzebyales bacterium]
MLREYQEFLFRGNLLDLAVAFILGAAFNAVVQSFANDVIMAPISAALGFDDLSAMRAGGIAVGLFLAALLSFVVIATVLFFIIKAAERFKRNEELAEETPVPTDETVLLREIRDLLAHQAPADRTSTPPSI